MVASSVGGQLKNGDVVAVKGSRMYHTADDSELKIRLSKLSTLASWGELGWPMRSMNAEASPAAGCAIPETADRGITLRQLLAVWEHILEHCEKEG